MGARGPKPGCKVGGRTKGTPNKIPKAVKEMVLEALGRVGGAAYLAKQANDNPAPFMALIARIIPTQVTADVNTTITEIRETFVDPRPSDGEDIRTTH
jgi:hypothetical protein